MLSHGGAVQFDSISSLGVVSDMVLLKLRLYFVHRILNRLNRYERQKRGVCVMSVKRNVRVYTPNLVKTTAI